MNWNSSQSLPGILACVFRNLPSCTSRYGGSSSALRRLPWWLITLTVKNMSLLSKLSLSETPQNSSCGSLRAEFHDLFPEVISQCLTSVDHSGCQDFYKPAVREFVCQKGHPTFVLFLYVCKLDDFFYPASCPGRRTVDLL